MSGYVSSVHSITEKPNNETITEITNFDSKKVVGLYVQYMLKVFDKVLKTFGRVLTVTLI